MTALMIRDYVAQDFPGNPVHFAKEYYLHYPKIAFGSWPPLLHILLGGWLLIFPATRDSGILYIDLLTAIFAVAAGWIASRRLPWPLAAAVGVGCWLSRVPQRLDQGVQADTQYALFSMACVYLFAAYLDKPGVKRATCFGIALLAAVMTKNNGLFLAISLPIAVLLTRSLAIVRRRDAWLAVIPGVLVVAVWQYFTLAFNRNNMKGVTEVSTPGLVLFTYLQQLVGLVWIALLPLVLWGIYRRVWVPLARRRPVDWFEAGSLALLVGPCLFHSMLPHDVNQRYLMPSLPPLLIFAAYGLLDLLFLPVFTRVPRAARLAAAAGLIAIPAIAAGRVPPEPSPAYSQVAAAIISQYPAQQYPSIFVESSFDAEARFICEMAVRERRPGHWLLRAMKLLRHRSGTLNRETEIVDTPPEEMLRYFEELPVSLVVLAEDGAAEQQPMGRYVAAMMRQRPELFSSVLATPIGGTCHDAPCTIEVYRLNWPNAPRSFSSGKLPQNMPLWLWP